MGKKRTFKRDTSGKFSTTGGAVAGKKVTKKKAAKKTASGYTKTVLHPGQTTLSGMTTTLRRKKGFYKDLQAQLKAERKRKKKK